MRIVPLLLATLTLVGAVEPSIALARRASEPPTSTIRIRLKGDTLRVRCRGGDCIVSVVGQGAGVYAVSVTRTRYNGVPFTFARNVENPKNIAVETGIGNDQISLANIDIPGFLRVGTATGDDTLSITDTRAAGKGTIDLGSGNDTAALDTVGIGDKFRLASKGGDDDVTVSGGSYAGKSGFDGGPGTDGITVPTGAFSKPPVIRAFEQ